MVHLTSFSGQKTKLSTFSITIIFSFILLFSTVTTTFGQNQDTKDCLFFRIPTSSKKIEQQRINGNEKEVNLLIKNDKEIKQAILRDFKMNYDASEVYFFPEDDLANFTNKKWDDVHFVNASGDTIKLSYQNSYWVANYGINPPNIKDEGGSLVDRNDSRLKSGIVLRNAQMEAIDGRMRFTEARLFKKRVQVNGKKVKLLFFSGAKQLGKKWPLLKHLK